MKKVSLVLAGIAMMISFLNVLAAPPATYACKGGCVDMDPVPLCACQDKAGTPPGECVAKCNYENFQSIPVGNCMWTCHHFYPNGEPHFTDRDQRNCWSVQCKCSKKKL